MDFTWADWSPWRLHHCSQSHWQEICSPTLGDAFSIFVNGQTCIRMYHGCHDSIPPIPWWFQVKNAPFRRSSPGMWVWVSELNMHWLSLHYQQHPRMRIRAPVYLPICNTIRRHILQFVNLQKANLAQTAGVTAQVVHKEWAYTTPPKEKFNILPNLLWNNGRPWWTLHVLTRFCFFFCFHLTCFHFTMIFSISSGSQCSTSSTSLCLQI